jgi:DNA-binding response OmpR family regulator
VMFSALSSDDDIERARLAGANHLITKPFNLVGLGSVVKTFFPADVGSAR